MRTNNEALTRRWFEEVWSNNNEAAIDKLMAPDVIAHGLGPDFVGRDNFHIFFRHFREPFSSIQVTPNRVIVAGDETAYRGRADATAKGSGEHFVFDGAGFIRFKNGRIVEGWNYWDFLGLAVQTRVIPQTVVQDALRSVAGAQS